MYPMSSALKLRNFFLIITAIFLAVNPATALVTQSGQMQLIGVITTNDVMGGFNQPTSFFFDENKKRLYISDTGANRLVSFDNEFLYLADLKQEELELPMGIVRNKTGQFFVVSGSTGDIKFIDVKERVIKSFDILGLPEQVEKFVPGRIAIDKNDLLYVVDRLNNKILVLDTTGAFLKEMTVKDENFYGFTDVRVNGDGNIYALDTIGGVVYVFDKEGELLLKFGNRDLFAFPISLAVDSNGLIYVADQHQGKVKIFGSDGIFLADLFQEGWKEGELLFPSYIFVDKEDRLYIIDRGNNRIQIFKERTE